MHSQKYQNPANICRILIRFQKSSHIKICSNQLAEKPVALGFRRIELVEFETFFEINERSRIYCTVR